MVEVLSTGVTPEPDHPMLWVSFGQTWTRATVEITARLSATHPIMQRLPEKLRFLIRTLARCGVIVRIQLAEPTNPDSPQNSLRLQARPTTATVSVAQRLLEIIETLEELTGHTASKNEIEREAHGERYPPGQSPAQLEIHQLRMRWQLALKRYLA